METKGFLTTRERIIPGEGQGANVYDFAKLLKAVTKAARMGGKGTAGGGASPRKESSGEGRKEISGGRRKNVSAQRLKKRSGEGWKDDSALEYVAEDELLDEDLSNLRQAATQQKRGRGRPAKERLRSGGDRPKVATATVSPGAAAGGETRSRPATPDDAGSPEATSREREGRGDGDHALAVSERDAPGSEDGAAGLADVPARGELHVFAEVAAREFNDQAPFRATLSRIVNLYHRAGLPSEEFTERLDAARQRTKERTGAVRTLAGKQATHGRSRKNTMPYFFAIFEDLLGLRESPALPAPDAGEGATPAGRESNPAVPGGWDRRPSWRSYRGENAPADRPAPAPERVVAGTPDPGSDEDARLIKTVVSTFGRQFADFAAAEALGEWAVTLWQESHLSRERFLAAATEASEQLLRDRATSPSAALFRNGLMRTVERLGDGTAVGTHDRGESPAPSAPIADGAAPRDRTRA